MKDFRGLDPNGFDKSGNYNFGFTEQTVFPEVDGACGDVPAGHEHHDGDDCNQSPDHGRELLKQFGFPFRDKSKLEGQVSIESMESGVGLCLEF